MEFGKYKHLLSSLIILLLSSVAINARQGVTSAGSGVVVPDSVAVAWADSVADAINLGEVVVVAPIKPIIVKGDTTIIDTRAFQTRDGAFLEELIRIIPGMAYDKKNGTLTYNGKPINDININGKSFLKEGKTLALENLQADLFSKIKIYDKSSDTDTFLGIKSSGQNYVLDLSTKGEYNGSLMVRASVGGGSEQKKEAEISANSFMLDGDSYSLRLESGNRRLTSRMKGNRDDSGFIHISKLFSNKFSIGFNGHFSHDKLGDENSNSFEQYLPAGNTYTYSQGVSRGKNLTGNGNVSINWQPDKMTKIYVEGNLSATRNRNNSDSRSAAFDANPGLDVTDPFGCDAYGEVSPDTRLNSLGSVTDTRSSNGRHGFSAVVTRKLNKRGSAMSLTADISNGRGKSRAFNESETHYYRLLSAPGRDSLLYRNRYSVTPTVSRSRSVSLRFIQPLVKEWKMEVNYSLRRSREHYTRSTYDLTSFFDTYAPDGGALRGLPDGYEETLVDSLSNHSFNLVTAQRVEARLMYMDSKWHFNLSMAVEPERRTLDQKTGLNQADTVRRSVNYSPRFQMNYYGKMWNFSLSYDGNTSQPQLSSLLSLTDNSNPLSITRGNPRLKASYAQNFRFDLRHNPLGLMADLSFSNTFNQVTRAVSYNPETGGQLSYPVNINGDRSVMSNLRYFKFMKHWLMSADVGGTYNRNVGLVNEGMTETPRRSVTRSRSISTRLGVNFMSQRGGFNLSADWQLHRSSNDFRTGDVIMRDYTVNFGPHLDLPCGLSFSADLDYRIRTGTDINPRDFREVVCNTEVKWRFLKQRTAEISLSWMDMLSDRKSYSRAVNASGIHESYNPQIGSYVFVTFSYHFNKNFMGKTQVRKNE